MSTCDNGSNSVIYNYEDFLSKKDLEQVIQITFPQKIFTIENVDLRPATAHKLGFMCDHLRMKVHVKFLNETKNCYYFLKCVPIANEEMKEFLLKIDAFEKEKKIYAIFNSLSTSLGKKPWYPICYFSNEKIIMLEDLSQKGFRSFDPRAKFTKEHCFTALAAMARLHSSCLSFEEKKTKELGTNFRLEKEYEKYLDTFYYEMSGYYKTSMDALLEVVEKKSKYAQNPPVIEIIKSKWTSIWEKNIEFAKPSKIYRNVNVQRDSWGGNLMYRYENSIPRECIVIDYQSFGWQPPASDVMDILYLNINQKDRLLWESECTEYYFNELQKYLLEDKILVENVLSKDEFIKSCDDYKFWGLIHACCEHQMIYLNRDFLDNILEDSQTFGTVMNTGEGRKKVVFDAFENDKLYRDIVLESLEELIDKYILA